MAKPPPVRYTCQLESLRQIRTMQLVRRHRGSVALLALSLIVPRLLVPMGYMPGTDAQGRPAIVVCDDAARAAFFEHAGGAHIRDHGPMDGHDGGKLPMPPHEHRSHDTCPFGMSVGPADLPVVTVAGADLRLPLLVVPAASLPVASRPSVAAHGPRAPPRV